ncbi:MAG: NAD(+)/NADH kinase [Bacillota bacterium]
MGDSGAGRRIGIYPNLEKQGSRELTAQILDWLTDRGHSCYLPPCIAKLLGFPEACLPIKDWAQNGVDFGIVLGGDGTLLAAARALGPIGVPLLGVNLGHFGFLTELESTDLFAALPSFISGACKRDERITLTAEVIRDGQMVYKSIAMNEAAVVKGPYGRMTALTLRVHGSEVDTYFADGVIVATPTGSTAYSLSAGGPLMSPEIDAMLVTPVCAHTLYSRSIVLPSSEPCEIEICEPSRSTSLSIDGQEFLALLAGDRIRVYTTGLRVVLLRRSEWSFYDVLRRKMKEGADRLPR